MKKLLVIFFLLIGISCFAQTITGPTSVYEGNLVTYEYYEGFMGIDPNFNIIGGTKWNESFGTPYTVQVLWGLTGTGTVQYRSAETVIAELNVTILVETPPTPYTSFDVVPHCGNTQVTRTSDPNYLVQWYWQTSSTGTSTALGYGSSISPTASGDYYLRARREDHPSVWSASSLYVGNISVISSAPTPGSIGGNVSICAGASGGTISNQAGASGQGLTSYQWEQSADGVNWNVISGAYATTYGTPGISATTYYRRGVNNICGTTYTNTVTISVYSSLNPGSVDGSQTICYGQSPSTLNNLSLPSGSTESYTYQWQSSPNGSSWTNISEATSASYSPGSLTSTTIYRRLVSTSCGTTNTNTVTVTVNSPLSGGSINSNQTICSGSTPVGLTSTSSPSNGLGGYSYQWEQSPNASTWSNASGSSTSATYNPPSLTSDLYYRRKVTSCGATTYTGNVLITVNATTVGGSVSGSIEAYGKASGTLTLSGYNAGAVILKWQKKEGAGSWDDITNTSATNNYTNVNTTTYYRADVKNGVCTSAFSSQATITIHNVPTIQIIGSASIAPGGSTQLQATAGLYKYTWKKAGVTIGAATTNTLTVTKPGTYTVAVKATSTSPVYETGGTVIKVAMQDQLQDINYVTSTGYNIQGVTTSTDDYDLQLPNFSTSTDYFDGLGKPLQKVNLGGGGNAKDIIQPISYDGFGREAKNNLPYTHSLRDGRYQPGALAAQLSFYASGPTTVPDDNVPYSLTVFEASPLNRPSKSYDPGQAWSTTGSNKFIEQRYLFNIHGTGTSSTAEKIIAWKMNGNLPVRSSALAGYIETNGYYSSGQLYVNVTIDEQGNSLREYKTKEGVVVLKKVQVTSAGASNLNDLTGSTPGWALTYYVYDDLGNLRIALPPELSKIVHQNDSYNPTSTDLGNWSFLYKYDNRKRMSVKKVPGADSVYMVYDNRDRLVLTQDGVQRTGATNAIKHWTFTKYDELNRPILTGIKDTTTTVQLTQAQMQSVVDAHFAKAASRWSEEYVGNVANNMHGYTNKAYPVRGSTAIEIEANKYLTVTYYDNYTFRNLWSGVYTYLNESLSEMSNGITYTQPTTESLLVKGQVTGMKVKVLDGGTTGAGAWIRSVNYYDDKNRPVQSISDNIAGGIDRSTTVLDFTGKVLKNKTSHSILWKDLVGVEATPAGLTRTLVGTGWTAGAASVDILPSGTNGWVEVQVAEINKLRMIGLSKENTGTGTGGMDYAVNLNLGNYTVYENGVNRGNKATITTGDMIRIERTGSTVKYLKNGLEVFTSTVASSTPLMVDATLNEYGATLPNLNFSFKNNIPRSITRRFEYDHAGRLMKTWHQVDAQAEILLASNTYNELGQLVDKKLHSTVATATNAKQSIDYRYNIRGWLTKINESDIEVGKNDASNAGEARDYFGMELGYNNDIGVANTSLFNGNISAMKWSKNQGLSTAKESAYNYSYDPMNRITAAAFKEKATSWNALANNGFSESNYTYDLNGNILTLTRYDQRGSTAPMDNLTMLYSYGSSASQSNKLLKVTDTGDVNAGFLDGTTATTEYGYNDNGSMTFDSNKEIKSPISYNYLNLPELLTRGTSNTIRYIYDATGRKLSQVVSYSTSKKRTDYIGEYQYENSMLQSISHEEGRIALSNEVLAYQNAGDNSIGFTTTTASLTPVTQNTNQTYLKVISSGTTARSGISNVVTLGVVPGERYKIRAKGYRDKGTSATSNPVYLLVQFNGVDKDFPGATLGSALTSEAWTEQIVTIPASVNTLQAGIIWNTTVTAGELFYLNDFEVIKLNTNPTPEYQYNLTDHLGNVRVTFTTKDEIEAPIGTFEEINKTAEQGKFLRYDKARRVQSTWFDRTNGAVTGYAHRLNGSADEKYGIARSISVMPGDKINAEVYAKYVDTNSSNWTAALNTLLTQIAGGTASAGTVIDGSGYNTSTSSFPFAGLIDKSGAPVVGPKAYLNWLVFDKNYVFLNGGYKKMSDVAKEYGQDVAHEYLSSPDINITQPGFVYIYLSNEEATPVEVYFDDFKVTHTKSPVIQMQDYYPFGLTFNSYRREDNVPNNFLYNQGTGEKTFKTERVYDLGLNVDESKFRSYDYTTARWWQVDPKADNGGQESWSPYQYSFNDPIRNNDPEGDICIPCATALAGAVIGAGINAYDQYKEGKLDLTDGTSLARLGTAFVAGGIAGSGLGGLPVAVAVAAGGEAADQLISTGNVNDLTKVGIAAGAGFGGGLLAKGATAVAAKTGLITIAKNLISSNSTAKVVSTAARTVVTTNSRQNVNLAEKAAKATVEGVNGIVTYVAGKVVNTALTPPPIPNTPPTTPPATTTTKKPEEKPLPN